MGAYRLNDSLSEKNLGLPLQGQTKATWIPGTQIGLQM